MGEGRRESGWGRRERAEGRAGVIISCIYVVLKGKKEEENCRKYELTGQRRTLVRKERCPSRAEGAVRERTTAAPARAMFEIISDEARLLGLVALSGLPTGHPMGKM